MHKFIRILFNQFLSMQSCNIKIQCCLILFHVLLDEIGTFVFLDYDRGYCYIFISLLCAGCTVLRVGSMWVGFLRVRIKGRGWGWVREGIWGEGVRRMSGESSCKGGTGVGLIGLE